MPTLDAPNERLCIGFGHTQLPNAMLLLVGLQQWPGTGMTKTKPIVFLGLSLCAEAAGKILLADYRGPIRKGDLDVIPSPATVVIIDGVLSDSERLPTAEAKRALQRGLTLFGASSTGALLAIELENDGMRGFGRVFGFLRRYRGDRADLVSLLYTAEKNRPVTVPIINIVLGCLDAGFDTLALEELTKALAAIPLHQRTWDTIGRTVLGIGLNLPSTIHTADAKQVDARELLTLVRLHVHSR